MRQTLAHLFPEDTKQLTVGLTGESVGDELSGLGVGSSVVGLLLGGKAEVVGD